MGIEIERKFLLTSDEWRHNAQGQKYVQGYINQEPGRTVRVRITEENSYLTIKGKPTEHAGKLGSAKLEFEYIIPQADAEEMIEKLCSGPIISKTRYRVQHKGFVWEVDEFYGDNEGLILAEIELEHEDQHFETPSWIGEEVTSDKRYYNARLSRYPYSEWKDQE